MDWGGLAAGPTAVAKFRPANLIIRVCVEEFVLHTIPP
jgi:hypothetical protein